MSRIACVWIPSFAAQVERQRASAEARPLIVLDASRVLAACEQAMAMGVCEGDTFRQAMARCPDARMIPADRPHYRNVWARLLDGLSAHSPALEDVAWGLAYLEATGMEGLYGTEADWCQAVQEAAQRDAQVEARVGVAGTKFAAWLAARSPQAEGGYQVVTQDDRAYLSPLSVDWLPLSAETLRRCRLLGIRTIGQWARLRATAIAEQFGPECLEAHQWARGKDRRPLLGQRRKIRVVRRDFEEPEFRHEALLAAMLEMSQGALSKLEQNWFSMQRIEVKLALDDGRVWEGSAWVGDLASSRKFKAILTHLLTKAGGEGEGITGIEIKLVGLEHIQGEQVDLYAYASGRLHLDQTLHKLALKHSPQCVVRPRPADSEAPLAAERYRLEEQHA